MTKKLTEQDFHRLTSQQKELLYKAYARDDVYKLAPDEVAVAKSLQEAGWVAMNSYEPTLIVRGEADAIIVAVDED